MDARYKIAEAMMRGVGQPMAAFPDQRQDADAGVRQYAANLEQSRQDSMGIYRAASSNAPMQGRFGPSSISAYKPSWRDRIAQAILGDERPSPTKRRMVEGLVGSSGLGNTGIGLADFVPGGQVLSMQEAAAAGDMRGAAMAVVPLVGRANIAANNIIRHTGRDVPTYGAGPGPTAWSDLAKTKHTIPVEDMRAGVIPQGELAPRTIIDPQSLQGSILTPAVGDRTRAGASLVEINEKPLAYGVSLEGGPNYMRGAAAQGPDASVWASDEKVIKRIANQNKKLQQSGQPVNFVYSAMGARSGDFSHMTADALLAQIPGSKILNKDVAAFDAVMRKRDKNWPGLENIEAVRQALLAPETGTKLRKPFVEEMAKGKYQKAGFPDVGSTRFAIQEPDLALAPTGATGYNIAQLTPQTRLVTNPAIPHTTYPADLGQGRYLGGLDQPVPREVMFPDFYATRRAAGKPVEADDRAFSLSNVSQRADQQWLDNFMRHLEAQQSGAGLR
jgi:hypothetical protein